MPARPVPPFGILFELGDIPRLARAYLAENSDYDGRLEREVAPVVRRQGYYTRDQFLEVCAWKSPRSKPLCGANNPDVVREATSIALSARDERLRVGILRLLRGVAWPTASVLLHWGHRDPYPILDFRALEALGAKAPKSGYDFEFWWAYVEACRRLADAARVNMRTLDRALWQFSKERATGRMR